MEDQPEPELDSPFDFITDVELRASLQSDYAELQTCLEAGASKAVLVLSGSVVEAILVDHLLSTEQRKPDPLRMSLDELVEACRTTGVLTQRTADLSSVIRSYRNLIHPGRLKRLAEGFTTEDSRVAAAVVNIIAREVSDKQVALRGLTAEQIVRKFETDPSASGIADLLLRDVRAEELERLLLEVLPSRYFDRGYENLDTDIHQTLEQLYHSAFDLLPPSSKKKVATRFADVIREDAGPLVAAYEDRLFRARFLQFMDARQREVVLAHLFARIEEARGMSTALIDATAGLSWVLKDEEQHAKQQQAYIDALLRTVAYAPDPRETQALEQFVREFAVLANPVYELAKDRVTTWKTFLESRGSDYGYAASLMEKIRAALDDAIPF